MKNILQNPALKLALAAAFVLFMPVTPLLFAADMDQTAPAFDNAIEDLPLMPGLTAAEDQDVLFTTHAGRIAESTASGAVGVDQVYQFYKKTLPQLGWQPVDTKTYKREGEKLSIDAQTRDNLTTVKFSVKPAP